MVALVVHQVCDKLRGQERGVTQNSELRSYTSRAGWCSPSQQLVWSFPLCEIQQVARALLSFRADAHDGAVGTFVLIEGTLCRIYCLTEATTIVLRSFHLIHFSSRNNQCHNTICYTIGTVDEDSELRRKLFTFPRYSV